MRALLRFREVERRPRSPFKGSFTLVRRRLATRQVVTIEGEPGLQLCPRAWIVPFQEQRPLFEMNRPGKISAFSLGGRQRVQTIDILVDSKSRRCLAAPGKHFGKISVPVWRKRAPLGMDSMVTALAARMCESTTFRSRSMGANFSSFLGPKCVLHRGG